MTKTDEVDGNTDEVVVDGETASRFEHESASCARGVEPGDEPGLDDVHGKMEHHKRAILNCLGAMTPPSPHLHWESDAFTSDDEPTVVVDDDHSS